MEDENYPAERIPPLLNCRLYIVGIPAMLSGSGRIGNLVIANGHPLAFSEAHMQALMCTCRLSLQRPERMFSLLALSNELSRELNSAYRRLHAIREQLRQVDPTCYDLLCPTGEGWWGLKVADNNLILDERLLTHRFETLRREAQLIQAIPFPLRRNLAS